MSHILKRISTNKHSESRNDIAIIGMSCRFPNANNYGEYWNNLSKGINSIKEIPPDRWDINKYFSTNKNATNVSVSKWAGLLDDITNFDAAFFNISPREASSMDPQQRLLLEEAWYCVEDAAIPISILQEYCTSVYIGAMSVDYHQHIIEISKIDNYSCIGNYTNVLANRISCFFGLTGISESINTACSSSLVAIHQARKSLIINECKYAFAGGVSIICHPMKYISFSKSNMLSPDGQCKTFDAEANGYVPGEGVGLLLMTTLENAIQNGYRIHGIIRGSAVNHVGNSSVSITAPSIESQSILIKNALKSADISARDITYVEAHGTGTPLGDPIEFEALANAFGYSIKQGKYCVLGSVKPNIGHLEAAAGIAGVIKVLLMMKHKKIVPLINFNKFNPLIDIDNSPFCVQDKLVEWKPNTSVKRYAGVSSFGFGGTNAHIIIEEYADSIQKIEDNENAAYPFVLSAKSMHSMAELMHKWKKFVNTDTFKSANLKDISYTLLVRNPTFKFRQAFLINNKNDILQNLHKLEMSLDTNAKSLPKNIILSIESDIYTTREDFRKVCINNKIIEDIYKGCCQCLIELKHKFIVNAWANTEYIDTSYERIFKLVVVYCCSKYILRCGLKPCLIYGTGTGKILAAMLSDFISLHDGFVILLSVYNVIKPSQKLRVKYTNPSIPFYDSYTGEINYPLPISIQMCQNFRTKLKEDTGELDKLKKKVDLLVNKHYALQQYLKEWDRAISTNLGIGYWQLLDRIKIHDKLYNQNISLINVVHMVVCSKLERKWGFTKNKSSSIALNGIADLILDKIISYDIIIKLIYDENDSGCENFRLALINSQYYSIHPALKTLFSDGLYKENSVFNLGSKGSQHNLDFSNISFTKLLGKEDKASCISVGKATNSFHEISLNSPTQISLFILKLWRNGYISSNLKKIFKFKGKVISLPQYSFTRNKYWLNRDNNKSHGFINDINPIDNDSFEPRFDQHNIEDNRHHFTKTLSIDNKYIRDHIINDVHIIPGAFYLIYLLKAYMITSNSSELIEVYDVIWPSPCSISDGQDKLELYIDESRNDIALCRFNFSKHDKNLLCCKASIRLKKIKPIGLIINKDNTLSVLGNKLKKDDIYSFFSRFCYQYGNSLRNLEWIKYNKQDAIACYSSPSVDRADFDNYIISPSVIDGALQVAVLMKLISEDKPNKLYIPYRVSSIRLIAKPSYGGYIYASKHPISRENEFVINLQILDSHGNLCIDINQCVIKSIDISNDKFLLDTSFKYYKRIWVQKKPAVIQDRSCMNSIIFIGSKSKLSNTVKSLFTNLPFIHIQHGRKLQKINKYEFSINFSSETDWIKLFSELHAQDIKFSHIIFASNHHDVIHHNCDELMDSIQKYILLIKAVSKLRIKEKVFIFNLYANATPLAIDKSYLGLAKTLIQENQNICIKIIGIDSYLNNEALKLLTEELHTDLYPIHVRISNNIREVEKFTPTFADYNRFHHIFKHKGVYLLTGGLGGIGFIIAKHLANKYKARLILTGRTAANKIEYSKLLELYHLGAIVRYYPGDISNIDIVNKWINKTTKSFGELNGIIHLAAIIDDKLFINKSPDDFIKVCSPKIKGVLNLDKATKNLQLDVFICFSSIIGCLGNIGQSDYALSNSFLDVFSYWRNEKVSYGYRYGKTLSIDWPYWESGGMILNHDQQARLSRVFGLMPISTKEGIKSLNHCMGLSTPQLIVGAGDYDKLEAVLNMDNITNSIKTNDSNYLPNISALLEICAEVLQTDKTELEPEAELNDYGMDSIMIMQVIDKIEKITNNPISPNLISDYPTIAKIAKYLSAEDIVIEVESNVSDTNITPDNSFAQTDKKNEDHDSKKVAIIAMSGRFPQAHTLEQYWNNIKNSVDSIIEIPSSRWNIKEYFNSDKNISDTTYCKWGGFLDDIDLFDPDFFSIDKTDTPSLDPQQRILLELTQELLDRAHYQADKLRGRKVGVFIGGSESFYLTNNTTAIPINATKHFILNRLPNMLAARISNFYDFRGPACLIDTACSSSLVAVHQACQSILNNEIEYAVSGGINLLLTPQMHIGFSKAKVLSDDSINYVFDKRSKGFIPSEGAGLVLLKSYNRAIADGDQILGIISGSAVNNDGYTIGTTTPSGKSQEEVIAEALHRSKVSSADIEYYEAHGTGTLLGDPIEIQAAKNVYLNDSSELHRCAIGSVKSNIGHCLYAAGIASLIKTVMALNSDHIPPTIHCEQPHPRFKFDDSPFYPITELQPWRNTSLIRRAAISSFGFGGTNCHMIVENEKKINANNLRDINTTAKFNRKSYWIRTQAIKDASKDKSFQDFKSYFSSHDQYINDHLVYNEKVMLGVTHFSLAIEAYIQNRPSIDVLGLKNVYFNEAITLNNDDKVEICVKLKKDNDQLFFENYYTKGHKNRQKLAASGEYIFNDISFLSDISLDKIKNNASNVEHENIYGRMGNIKHGLSLQSIQHLYYNETEALGYLNIKSSESDYFASYYTRPELLDAAIVCALYTFNKQLEIPFIPIAVKRVLLFSRLPSSCISYAKLIKQNDEIIVFDINLCDTNGKVLVKLAGLTCKKLKSSFSSTTNEASLHDRIVSYLQHIASTFLGKGFYDINTDVNLLDSGLDSSQLIECTKKIESDLGIELYPTLIFEYTNITQLSSYFEKEFSEEFSRYFDTSSKDDIVSGTDNYTKSSIDDVSKETSNYNDVSSADDIAIIGIAGMFPDASNINSFWDEIKNGTDLISEIPLDHWDYKPWFDEESQRTDSLYCKWGSFIKDFAKFDAAFFNITPREAELMDPQLRLLLECMYTTFEDAGYAGKIKGTNTGIYIGACFHDYQQKFDRTNKPVASHDGTGNAATMLANRPSFFFDLKGPSIVIDTACSSSLVALHTACQALKCQECSMAVAGGVNLLLNSWHYRYFCSIGALSHTGRCHTFDDRADGYVPGEAVGTVLLKPLSAAIKDNDRIHAVIKGSATNHGGYTPSITAPSVKQETDVIIRAWNRAGINPENIQYIEAHGTGTKLGDPVEIDALKKAFSLYTNKTDFCAIGSTKAHIGHTEGAAGIVGIIKSVMALKHKTIPAMPNFNKLNPYVNLRNSALFINEESINWDKTSNGPRLAGVSSFGFGGAYAHAVIAEYEQKNTSIESSSPYYIIVLSAKCNKSLTNYICNLIEWLRNNIKVPIQSIAYTLNVGRQHFNKRYAIVVESNEQLIKVLEDIYNGNQNNNYLSGTYRANSSSLSEKNIADISINYLTNNPAEHKKQLLNLASLYIHGNVIDFNALYEGEYCQIIDLPTYSFNREKYYYSFIKSNDDLADSKKMKLDLNPINNKLEQLNNMLKKDNVTTTSEAEFIDSQKSKKNTINTLRHILADLMFIEESKLDNNETFADYGLDSILVVEFVKKINSAFNVHTTAANIYACPDINKLSDYLCAQTNKKAKIDTRDKPGNIQEVCENELGKDAYSQSKKHTLVNNNNVNCGCSFKDKKVLDSQDLHNKHNDEDIAIIGMATYLPGAQTIEEYWENISAGISSIKTIPADRWSIEKFYSPNTHEENKSYCKYGGFIDGINLFDPLFFAISPNDAESMDPQQRLFLEVSWLALRDAGLTKEILADANCGIYAGVMNNDYSHMMPHYLTRDNGSQQMIGNSNSVLASRISYFLNLKGPAIAIDTACSSSLVATHLACQSLRNKDCNIMVAGGVTLYLNEIPYIQMSKANMLSHDSQCKVFDDNADGFIPGEGCAAIVLKRLQDAINDNDRIYGIITASGINHDGKTNGITAPNPDAQTKLITSVYNKYSINPENISYIEAHGTGTKLGDPIEIQGLTNAFKYYTSKNNYCAIGSVKSNIGHTSAVSGIASLIKVLLCMQHKKFVPSINFNNPNSHIDFQGSPFYVNTRLCDWNCDDSSKRLAGISSFGFSGTNSHVVVEEYNPSQVNTADISGYHIIVVSSNYPETLKIEILNLRKWLKKHSDMDLGDLAYTLNMRRDHFKHRFATIASSLDELEKKLDEVSANPDDKVRDCYFGVASSNSTDSQLYTKLSNTITDELCSDESKFDADSRIDNLNSLANLYTKGCRIDWGRLYKKSSYNLISTPLYVFRKKRYWFVEPGYLNDSKHNALYKTEHPTINDLQSSPCVHTNKSLYILEQINNDNLRTKHDYVFKVTINTEHTFFHDHYIDGFIVLPAVISIDFIHSIIKALELNYKIQDISWVKPLKLHQPSSPLLVTLSSIGQIIDLAVYSDNKIGENDPEIKGVIIPDNMDDSSDSLFNFNLNDLKKQSTNIILKKDFYESIYSNKINLGQKLQVIDEIYINNDQALSTIRLSDWHEETNDLFDIHPAAIDGGMQTAFAIINNINPCDKSFFIPYSMSNIFYSASNKSCYYALVKLGSCDDNDSMYTFSVSIFDDANKILFFTDNFVVKRTYTFKRNVAYLQYFYPSYCKLELTINDKIDYLSERILFIGSWNKLCDRLPANVSNENFVHVLPADSFTCSNKNNYTINITSPNNYHMLINKLNELDQMPNCIYISIEHEDNDDYSYMLDTTYYMILYLTKALFAAKPTNKIRVLILYKSSLNIHSLYSRALSGLIKTINLESTKVSCKIIDIQTPPISPRALLSEVCDSEDEIKYDTNNNRWVKKYKKVSHRFHSVPTDTGLPYVNSGVYIITGGFGKLATIFAEYLTTKHNARVVLLGRSLYDNSNEQPSRLNDRIQYLQTDLQNISELKDIVQHIKENFGNINGVIHTAGVLSDSLISSKTYDECKQVFASKVLGTINLDLATAHEPLDFFVLFSSLAAVFGNVGQSDYAYANAFLSAFVEYREYLRNLSKRNGISRAIDWPYWQDGGMNIANLSLESMRFKIGIEPLSTNDGILSFNRALALPYHELIVAYGSNIAINDNTEGEGMNYVDNNKIQATDNFKDIKLLRKNVAADIHSMVAKVLKVEENEIELNEEFSNYGFDSINLTNLANLINHHFKTDLTPAILFEYGTLNSFLDYFISTYNSTLSSYYSNKSPSCSINTLKYTTPINTGMNRDKIQYKSIQASKDIAIIGMDAILPGSPDLDIFWDKLVAQENLTTETPKSRYDSNDCNMDMQKFGGFIDNIDQFDADFFNISPREAELMDPQQRLLLQTTWKAIEDSGYLVGELSKSITGVYIGCSRSDYMEILQAKNFATAYFATGTALSILANRISYYLDLHGPSEVVDTACSSSLVAIHHAVKAIQNHDCDIAIAGGVNLMLTPFLHNSFDNAGMLSKVGVCKTFDKHADGYVRGEGVAVVILKDMDRALRDNDHIYGVIKGTAVNHGGHVNALTVPSPHAQAQVILKACANANIDLNTIGYIEAHGTGTKLGDPIEINGLIKAYEAQKKGITDDYSCAVSALKTNIGHLEAASGIAALVKVLLSLKYEKIPGIANFQELNPYIKLEKSPFYIATKTSDWNQINYDLPRRAGISSFGFGGTNAHIIVEEATNTSKNTLDTTHIPVYCVVLSAKTNDSLLQYINNLYYFLSNKLKKPYDRVKILADICYVFNVKRSHFNKRCAIIVKDIDELKNNLALLSENKGCPSAFITSDISHNEEFDFTKEKTVTSLLKSLDNKKSDESYYSDLQVLANFYAKGYDIDWSKLYHGSSGSKIFFPTYPFDCKAFWCKNRESETAKPITATTDNNQIKLKEIGDDNTNEINSQNHLDNDPQLNINKVPHNNDKLEDRSENSYILVCNKLRHILASRLYTEKKKIDETTKFVDYGLDSIVGVEIIKDINHEFNLNIEAVRLYDYPNISTLTNYLLEKIDYKNIRGLDSGDKIENGAIKNSNHDDKTNASYFAQPTELNTPDFNVPSNINATDNQKSSIDDRPNDIAIVGMSGRFPGANNLEEFWENLRNGKCSITEIPGNRWSIDKYYDPNPKAPNKTYSKWGGFLEDIDKFDPLFFQMTALEAEQMDPQQRIFLEECWHAFEDAGYTKEALQGKNCGVFVGVGTGDYYQNDEFTAYRLIGNSISILAARISYILDLSGPAMSIDTACSSSLVALHTAIQSLQQKNCSIAIAGGVCIPITPASHIMTCKAGFLSPDGLCKTFDNSANGFVPADAAGAVVLKPLTDALRDNDRIYAVIKGSAVNQDGSTNGITAPSANAQFLLESSLYKKINIDPSNITYVEAHGTGTKLGDPIEIQALSDVYREYTNKKQYCAIGSVKTNIGHAMMAAGICGFIKTVLCLYNRKLVPSLHFRHPNEHIDFTNSPFYVNTQLRDWEIKNSNRRLATVSSFGFSGTNVHMVLEEWVPELLNTSRNKTCYLILMSAKHPDALKEHLSNLYKYISQHKSIDIENISYTLGVRRDHYNCRCAFIASATNELQNSLKLVLDGKLPSNYLHQKDANNLNAYNINTESYDLFSGFSVDENDIDSYKKKLIKLANSYISGDDINCKSLYENDSCLLVSLPNYPFRKQRYWLNDSTIKNDDSSAQKSLDDLNDTDLLNFLKKVQDGKCVDMLK